MKKNNIVQVRIPHNHDPDTRILKRLEAKIILLEAAANSSPGGLKETFAAMLQELDVADSFGSYNSIYRTMRRIQEESEKKMYDYDEKDSTIDTEEMTLDPDEQQK